MHILALKVEIVVTGIAGILFFVQKAFSVVILGMPAHKAVRCVSPDFSWRIIMSLYFNTFLNEHISSVME